MQVRPALLNDAVLICEILRRSISELCEADHHNRDDILAPWLANKTPENVFKWIEAPSQLMLVAEIGNAIAGVGLATDEGEILLNYVAPEFSLSWCQQGAHFKTRGISFNSKGGCCASCQYRNSAPFLCRTRVCSVRRSGDKARRRALISHGKTAGRLALEPLPAAGAKVLLRCEADFILHLA